MRTGTAGKSQVSAENHPATHVRAHVMTANNEVRAVFLSFSHCLSVFSFLFGRGSSTLVVTVNRGDPQVLVNFPRGIPQRACGDHCTK
jgi:hypothetical protein